MKHTEIVRRIRREFKAFWKLTPWLLVAVLAGWLLWRSDLAASTGLFQSPPPTLDLFQSPPSTATIAPPPPPATPTDVPTEVVAPVVTTTEAFTATLMPSPTLEPTATAIEILPTPTQAPETPVPIATFAPTATMGSVESTATIPERYSAEDAGFVFDFSTLFDSVALGASYAWLCCGALLLLLVPLFFLVLWLAGKRRERNKE
jgi:hypothetical protein